jgi:hypothetical protein
LAAPQGGSRRIGRLGLAQVLKNCARLTEHAVLVHNARHQSGRIDLEEGRLGVFALEGVDDLQLVGDFESLARVKRFQTRQRKQCKSNESSSIDVIAVYSTVHKSLIERVGCESGKPYSLSEEDISRRLFVCRCRM